MSDLVVFGASCVVVGLAIGILVGLWAPPPRKREARVSEHPQVDVDSMVRAIQEFGVLSSELVDRPRHLTLVPPPPQFVDAEALGWLEGA